VSEASLGLRRLLARQWPWFVVCAGVGAGLVVVAMDRFRRGGLLLGASVLLAGWLRALLPPDRLGVLVIRRRSVDVAVLFVLGIGIVVLALVIPPGS